MKAIKVVMLALALLAAVVVLDGCGGARPGEEPEAMTEAQVVAGPELMAQTQAEAQVGESLLAWDEHMYTDDDDPGGVVRFRRDGDVVELCDLNSDGRGVQLWWGPHYVHLTSGKGSCGSYKVSNGYNLPEGKVIKFRICLYSKQYCDDAWWHT